MHFSWDTQPSSHAIAEEKTFQILDTTSGLAVQYKMYTMYITVENLYAYNSLITYVYLPQKKNNRSMSGGI